MRFRTLRSFALQWMKVIGLSASLVVALLSGPTPASAANLSLAPYYPPGFGLGTFLPLNSLGLAYGAPGDPDVCLVSLTVSQTCGNGDGGLTVGNTYTPTDLLFFHFRNDTPQPIAQLVLSLGPFEVGFYSDSPGTAAPSQALIGNPTTFVFSSGLLPGEITKLLWINMGPLSLQPNGGQVVGVSAFSADSAFVPIAQGRAITVPATFVPEPSTASLLASGFAVISAARRKRSTTL